MRSLLGMDAAFLSLETPTTPMHVGVVLLLDPAEGKRSLFSPSTRYAQIRRVIGQRIHLVAPLRQRAVRVPFGLHHPVWVDDPDFELDDHLTRASLPSPGGQAELDAYVASAMSRQLDPDRPLWEMHVVEGVEGGRTALIAKVHHAILDGVSGASVLAAFMDLTPRARVVPLPPEWKPAPLPSNAQMLRHAASSLARQPGSTLRTLQEGIEAVADLGMHNRELAGRGEHAPPGFFGAPRTSFNGAVSNRKRFASLSVPLEDVKMVGRSFEATVNDVVLACVSGGLRRLLESRGEELTIRWWPWCRSQRGPRVRAKPWATRFRACWCRWPPTSTTRWCASKPSASRPGWPRSRRSCTAAASWATWPRLPYRPW